MTRHDFRCEFCGKFMPFDGKADLVTVWTTERDSSGYVKDPYVDFPVEGVVHRECAIEGKYDLVKKESA